MKRLFATIGLMLALAGGALAQSNPNWSRGYVPTAAEWNHWLGVKQDYAGPPCLSAGCIMTGKLLTAITTAVSAGLNLPPGVAPTSPVDGDIWTTTTGLFVRINGTTVGPLGVGGGVGSTITLGTTPVSGGSTGQVLYDNGGLAGEYTPAQLTAQINLATASLRGALPAFPGNTTTFFRGDGSYQTLNCAALAGVGTGCAAAAGITALSGDVTATGPGSAISTLANIPTGTPMAGSLLSTAIVAPGTPAAGKASVYIDSTTKTLKAKNDAGTLSTTVIADTGASSNFLTAISAAGVISKAQPAFSDISGTLGATAGGTGQSTYTKGDLLCATGSTTLTKLGVGADTQTLVADSTQPCGVKWAGTGGGIVTWDPAHTSGNIILSNDNLSATSSSGERSTYGTNANSSGKYVFQITCTLCTGDTGAGFASDYADQETFIGASSTGVAVYREGGVGKVYHSGVTTGEQGSDFSTGSVLTFAVDIPNLRWWYKVDAGNWNANPSADPATNTGGFVLVSGAVFAGATPDTGDTETVNFNAGTLPSGFVYWQTSSVGIVSTSYQCLPYANRPPAPQTGTVICISDSNTATWGSAIAGSGGNVVFAFYNGSDWTVSGK